MHDKAHMEIHTIQFSSSAQSQKHTLEHLTSKYLDDRLWQQCMTCPISQQYLCTHCLCTPVTSVNERY